MRMTGNFAGYIVPHLVLLSQKRRSTNNSRLSAIIVRTTARRAEGRPSESRPATFIHTWVFHSEAISSTEWMRETEFWIHTLFIHWRTKNDCRWALLPETSSHIAAVLLFFPLGAGLPNFSDRMSFRVLLQFCLGARWSVCARLTLVA